MPDRIAIQLFFACLFFLLHRVVSGRGSCTQWGQSCWGGLGKRSENTADWYIARLLSQRPVAPQQLDDRNIFGSENVIRGPVMSDSLQPANVPRLEQGSAAAVPQTVWNVAADPVVDQPDNITKMRLYQLLSG